MSVAAASNAGVADRWPSISIVTPSFNQAQFLEATITSVLDQGYPALEYFIIDGGSTDGSREIIERHAPRLAGWVSERDAGQADAINKGWRRATGEVLAYLNSDDIYQPGALARVAEYFRRHPDTDMVYSDCASIGGDGRPDGPVTRMPQVSLEWLLRFPIPQPTMFFRRRLLDRIGLLNPALDFTMDWDFCLRAAVAGVVMRRVDGPPLAAFRSWAGQKTAGRFEEQMREILQIQGQVYADARCPAGLRSQATFFQAWVYLWPAYQACLRGGGGDALRLLRRAADTHPPMMLHPEFLRLAAKALLDRPMRTARRLLDAARRAA
jgi:glycosyltransferase involved in cell wall biosynthesis